MKTDRSRLEEATGVFFSRHWPSSFGEKPTWSSCWDMNGSMPFCTKGGVYCLLSKGAISYIGSGVSRGDSRYPEHGLSRRVMSHVVRRVRKDPKRTVEFKQKWQDHAIDELIAIGFPNELNYLALALEDFLIGQIDPPLNQKKRPGCIK